MSKRSYLTTNDIANWRRKHLTPIHNRPGYWIANEDLMVFKKVSTYPATSDDQIVIAPHRFKKPYDILGMGTNSERAAVNSWNRTGAIANLIIPKGAEVYIEEYKTLTEPNRLKMRASEAKIHSVVRIADKKQVIFGRSFHDSSFVYLNPKMLGDLAGDAFISPIGGFNGYAGQCASGIHFYINLSAAMEH
jgi:hypothetical protein